MIREYNTLYEKIINESGAGIITFFTPTYNRSKFLKRIYQCLKEQTLKQFVWIVVNDGAKDNTDEIALDLLRKNEIPMFYISKKNGGKHSAFKVALEACKTEYFQCMDDDDLYDANSVCTFLGIWKSISIEHKFDVGAIRTLSKLPNGKYASSKDITHESINDYFDCDTLEMNYIKRVSQENWTCYRTDALLKIDLFPEGYWLHDQHKFFLEGIWQGRFARLFKCRYVNVALRNYTVDAELSLMRAVKTRQHYLDMFINSKLILDEQLDYILKTKIQLVKRVLVVNLLRDYLNISIRELLSNTNSLLLRFLYIITFPISLFGNIVITSKQVKVC